MARQSRGLLGIVSTMILMGFAAGCTSNGLPLTVTMHATGDQVTVNATVRNATNCTVDTELELLPLFASLTLAEAEIFTPFCADPLAYCSTRPLPLLCASLCEASIAGGSFPWCPDAREYAGLPPTAAEIVAAWPSGLPGKPTVSTLQAWLDSLPAPVGSAQGPQVAASSAAATADATCVPCGVSGSCPPCGPFTMAAGDTLHVLGTTGIPSGGLSNSWLGIFVAIGFPAASPSTCAPSPNFEEVYVSFACATMTAASAPLVPPWGLAALVGTLAIVGGVAIRRRRSAG